MFSSPLNFRAVVLVLVTATAGGCTHFSNVTDMPAADGIPTYVSSRSWDDGTPRTVVTERVFEQPEEPCDLLEVQREFFDETGSLEYRQTDLETCREVLSRVTEDYDSGTAMVTRTVQLDRDRDGVFDMNPVVSRSVSQGELASLPAGSR